jgi:hypothetical protein
MNHSDADRKSVIDEARETLQRTSAERLAETRDGVTYEGAAAKWRREIGEMTAAREREKAATAAEAEREKAERVAIRRLDRDMLKTRGEIAQGFGAVNQLATKMLERIDDLTEENTQLKAKLSILETRFEDLKRSYDGYERATSAPVVDLKRRA